MPRRIRLPSDVIFGSGGIPSEAVWPEYNLHGDVLNRFWGFSMKSYPTTSSFSTTRRSMR
jgi:hypothetical protein